MPRNPREGGITGAESDEGPYQMTPRLQEWAASPVAALANLIVTTIAAIGVPLVGYVGTKTIDALGKLNDSVAQINTVNATTENRLRAQEALNAAQSEAIANTREKLGELRERTLRHEFLLEILERGKMHNERQR